MCIPALVLLGTFWRRVSLSLSSFTIVPLLFSALGGAGAFVACALNELSNSLASFIDLISLGPRRVSANHHAVQVRDAAAWRVVILAVMWSLSSVVLFPANSRADSQSFARIGSSTNSPPIHRIGPSFPCPVPHDPLAQLICSDPALSRLDVEFVQVYEALRQQVGEEGQQDLRQQAAKFGLSVRTSCGIAPAGAPSARILPPAAPATAAPCVSRAYNRQKSLWQSRLSEIAAEEAARPFEQQIGLQAALERLKFLPESATNDGIFGPATRAAIVAWQKSSGRQPTGFLGVSDASLLLAEAAGGSSIATRSISAPTLPNSTPAVRERDGQRITEAAASSSDELVPLERGVYVSTDTPCDMASNSTTVTYDGHYFMAGHDSFAQCVPYVKNKSGSTYVVARSCSGGGGDVRTYTLKGNGAFDVRNQYGTFPYDTFHYRLCSPANLPALLPVPDQWRILPTVQDIFCDGSVAPWETNGQYEGSAVGIGLVIPDSEASIFAKPEGLSSWFESWKDRALQECKQQLLIGAKRGFLNFANPIIGKAFEVSVRTATSGGTPSGGNLIALKLPGRDWVITSNSFPKFLTQVQQQHTLEQASKARMDAAVRARQEQLASLAKAKLTLRQQFLSSYGLGRIVPFSEIERNPFVYKGQKIGVWARFLRMTAAKEALFIEPNFGSGPAMLVTNIPTTLFTQPVTAVLAVEIIGLRDGQIDAKFLGDYLCQDSSSCSEFVNLGE